MTNIEKALAYFNREEVDAYEDDGSIYINIDNYLTVQISTAEVAYRAELYDDLMEWKYA